MMGKEGIYQREFIPAGRQVEQKKSWLISTLIGSALARPRGCVRGNLRCTILVRQSFVLFFCFLPLCVLGVCPQHRSGCTAAWTATSSFSTWLGSPTRWSSSPSQRDSPRFWLRRLLVRQKHSIKKTKPNIERDIIHRALLKKMKARLCG